jgi:F-type H+-transporting ATPase subunit gamma
MASLKDLKIRIGSVKNTQKITRAMKMVAAAKLKRAQEQAQASRPYAERMEAIVTSLARNVNPSGELPVLLTGTGKEETHLLVVATSDRGLCGAFNSSIVRAAKKRVEELQGRGKTVKIFCIGRKAYDQLRLTHGELVVERMENLYRTKPEFTIAQQVAERILEIFEEQNCDVCSVVYNTFKSAISQIVTFQQLVPLEVKEDPLKDVVETEAMYEYEPEEEIILADLLPRNLAIQVYRAMLENAASEQGARMTAMDNATRNAGDLIKDLTLQYNRTRQAAITTELTEIISGAEAL